MMKMNKLVIKKKNDSRVEFLLKNYGKILNLRDNKHTL